jgi:hypothetical protein
MIVALNRCHGTLDAVIRYTVCESARDHVVFGKWGTELLLDVSGSSWTGPEWAMKPLSMIELKRATMMYEPICHRIVQILISNFHKCKELRSKAKVYGISYIKKQTR